MDDIGRRMHVMTLLKRADASGKVPVRFGDLQAEAGIGAGDLMTTLELLVQDGTAQRVSDGTGGQAYMLLSEAPGPEPEADRSPQDAPFTADVRNGLEPIGSAARQIEALAARSPEFAATLARHAPAEPVAIVLTAGIVHGMHPEVIGAMVLAGVEDAGGAVFELRVLP